MLCALVDELEHFVTAMTSARTGSEVRRHVTSVEGHRVKFSCSFRVLFARQATTVFNYRWSLNGLTLSPSRRINISSPRHADKLGFWNSTLTFDPVVRSLSGQVNTVVINNIIFALHRRRHCCSG